MSLFNENVLFSVLNFTFIDLALASNLSYFWGVGSTIALTMVFQIVTGILLTSSYVATLDCAFSSVDFIMSELDNGWLISYLHSLMATFIILLSYLHISSGLYYGSFNSPSELLWISGVVLLVLMMVTAFLGYTLPFGAMSLWAAVVITNLFSAVPVIGSLLSQWIWGGFSVGGPTISSFFSMHYLLPFSILGIIVVHLVLLHDVESSDPTGNLSSLSSVSFHVMFLSNDLVVWCGLVLLGAVFIFEFPDFFGHPDNFIEADPLVTPASIVPEVYFLPFYAILSAIPNKFLGVVVLVWSILVLFSLPWISLTGNVSGNSFVVYSVYFWLFVGNFVLLGKFGCSPAVEPYVLLSSFSTVMYFWLMLFCLS